MLPPLIDKGGLRRISWEIKHFKSSLTPIFQSGGIFNLTDAIFQVKVTSKPPQPVNRSVSFHAIKSEVLNLLSSDLFIDKVLKKLRALFLTNPTLNKNQPTTPRNIKTARHLLHYHRTQRQHCF